MIGCRDLVSGTVVSTFYNSIGLGIVWGDLDVLDTVLLESFCKLSPKRRSIVCNYFLHYSISQNDLFEKEFGNNLGFVMGYSFAFCDT